MAHLGPFTDRSKNNCNDNDAKSWTDICDKNIMFYFYLSIQKIALRLKWNHSELVNRTSVFKYMMKKKRLILFKLRVTDPRSSLTFVWFWDVAAASLYLPLSAAPPCRVDYAERIRGGEVGVVGWHFRWTFSPSAPFSDCAGGPLASPAVLSLWCLVQEIL